MERKEYNDVILGWMDEVQKNRGIDAEQTLKACLQIEKCAMETNNTGLLGFAYYYSGETYYMLNDGENLFKYMTRALTYLDGSGQWELVARAYNIMAITSVNRGNQPIAMDYYLTGLNYCKKYQLGEIESLISINIGNLYMNYGEYREAQRYIENAYRYLSAHSELPEYYAYLNGIYYSMAKCYLLRNLPEKSLEYVERMEKECVGNMESAEILYTQAFKARLYHSMGRIGRRDECIAYVQENANNHIPIMDIFDDMYEYCEMLLEIEKDDELWDMIEILEQLAKQAKIMNLQREILALKIRYYRKYKKNAEYLQAAGLYFALTEAMEKENRYMVANMLDVRSSLERANEKRREMEEENEALHKKSETDALTGLSNRFRLNECMEEIFQKMLYHGAPFAVEILDIDYFKQYNDNYGHQAGDTCICALADELRKMQSDKIFCARYGGDEFVIIYQDMEMEEVFDEAEKLRQRILDLNMEHKFSKALPVVTISQGICWDIPLEETKTWDYLYAADTMLYKVKKKNRNSICVGNLTSDNMVKIGV